MDDTSRMHRKAPFVKSIRMLYKTELRETIVSIQTINTKILVVSEKKIILEHERVYVHMHVYNQALAFCMYKVIEVHNTVEN